MCYQVWWRVWHRTINAGSDSAPSPQIEQDNSLPNQVPTTPLGPNWPPVKLTARYLVICPALTHWDRGFCHRLSFSDLITFMYAILRQILRTWFQNIMSVIISKLLKGDYLNLVKSEKWKPVRLAIGMDETHKESRHFEKWLRQLNQSLFNKNRNKFHSRFT